MSSSVQCALMVTCLSFITSTFFRYSMNQLAATLAILSKIVSVVSSRHVHVNAADVFSWLCRLYYTKS